MITTTQMLADLILSHEAEFAESITDFNYLEQLTAVVAVNYNLRINYRQGESMYRSLVKAIDEFLKKKENKRAKPTKAEETLVFEDVKYAYEG